MTKIQYLVKEDKDSLYTKVSVPNRDFAETGKSRTVTRKKPTPLSLLKTLLTIAAASLLGAAIILWCCHFYQVRFHTCFSLSCFFLALVILLIMFILHFVSWDYGQSRGLKFFQITAHTYNFHGDLSCHTF